MACDVCAVFLEDFLGAGFPKDAPIHTKIRMTSLLQLTPELASWIHRVYERLSWTVLERCRTNASRIARRGRSTVDYDYLLNTATWNLLKYEVPWLENESAYIQLRLVEAGVCRGNHVVRVMSVARELLSYITPRALQCLHSVHDDHVHPKGLYTQLGSRHEERDETLSDRDDYQKEILEEDTDDLYN